LWGYVPRHGDTSEGISGLLRLYRRDGVALHHAATPMDQAFRTGDAQRDQEVLIQRPDGSQIVALVNVSLLRDDCGNTEGAISCFQDITDHKRQAEQSLATRRDEQAALFSFTDELYRAESHGDAYESAVKAIVHALRCDRASVLLLDDSKAMRFVAWRGLSDEYRRVVAGHSPWSADEPDPQPISIDDVAAANLPEPLHTVLQTEGIGALSFVPVMADGRLAGKFMTYYDAPHAYSAAELDIALTVARQLGFSIERGRAEDARRRSESEREFLVQELSHRVKNTLATVISIHNQSFSRTPSINEARNSFGARIRALAQTHGRLAEDHWAGVSFETLLMDELAPYRLEDGTNVQVSGPPVKLNAKSALTLGMAMHELATNAAKHGALSRPAGVVGIVWEKDPRDDQLRIGWKERGGPAVVRPERSGFGRLLLERVLSADLGGTVGLDFEPDGLQCIITIPLRDSLANSS
jgi:two-component sensor histidine kinase